MKPELGLGYCGLACCLCSENETCPGCRSGGCVEKSSCKCYQCCVERELAGCWDCAVFPCSGTILDKKRIRGFAAFAARYGAEKLLECLARNEKAGVVYHDPGMLTGDYDRAEDEEELFQLLLEGPDR